MKSITHFASLLAILALLQSPHPAGAQVAGAPATIDFQSQVLDTAGDPLAPGAPENFKMQFRIYSAQTGGQIVWSESQVVTVQQGVFSVRLGSGVPILGNGGNPEGSVTDLRKAFDGRWRYLGLTVEITGETAAEITPRMAFLSSPFSLVAERAKLADTATSADVAGSVIQPSGSSTLSNPTINGTTTLGRAVVGGTNRVEFGAGSADLAGKIGYNATDGSLEIQGSSAAAGDPRKISLRGNGGVDVGGDLRVGGKISGDGSGLTGVTADIAVGSIDLRMLVKAVQDALCPVGTIVAYSGDDPPPGWLMCDGKQLTGTGTYKALYDVIGTRFGTGNKTASRFQVPDLRGRFPRGRDNGVGRDPDAGSRVSVNEGASGDKVGSVQGDEFKSHRHQYYDVWHAEKQDRINYPGLTFQGVPHGTGSGATDNDNIGYQLDRQSAFAGGSETRPVNLYVNFIIKY